MLSIIICFCDKDFYYLNGLLKEIKEKVLIKYEIILIDNRINNKEILNLDKNIKITKSEINKTQFFRYNKKVLDLVEGERIWYIDVDDSIETIDKSFEKYLNYNEDIIIFSTRIVCTQESLNGAKEADHKSLHSKWLKTETCKKNFKDFPEEATIVFSEDNIALLTFKNQKKCKIDKTIYNYHLDNSENYGIKTVYSLETFERCVGVGLPYYEKMIKNDEEGLINIIYDIYKYIYYYFDNKKIYYEKIVKSFSREILIKFFKKYSYCIFSFMGRGLF